MENEEIVKQESVQRLNKEHIMAFKAIVDSKKRIALDTEAVRDDIKGLAEKLGWKPKKVNSVLSIMIKEEQEGGAIKETEEINGFVRQILNIED